MARIDYTELLNDLMQVQQRGRNTVIGTCPFCGKGNVMAFSSKLGVAKCFHCGEKATVLGLVMKVKNLSAPEAEKYIQKFIK